MIFSASRISSDFNLNSAFSDQVWECLMRCLPGAILHYLGNEYFFTAWSCADFQCMSAFHLLSPHSQQLLSDHRWPLTFISVESLVWPNCPWTRSLVNVVLYRPSNWTLSFGRLICSRLLTLRPEISLQRSLPGLKAFVSEFALQKFNFIVPTFANSLFLSSFPSLNGCLRYG